MDAMPIQRRLDRKTKIALIVFIVALIGSIAAVATWSAFSSTTANQTNQFSTGTLSLTDDDANQALFTMTGLVPGNTKDQCITVDYTGSLTSNVRLYGATTGGTGLNQYLRLKVERGTISGGTPPARECSGNGASFTPDSVTYTSGNGAGANGVLFDANMDQYPTTWAAGIPDAPGGTPEPWTNTEKHVYRFTVTVNNDNNAVNKTHTQSFTWEAQNV